MSVYVRLSNHGAAGHPTHIAVESYEGAVQLTVDPEVDNGLGCDRSLTASEARTLAAMLTHAARELEQGRA